MTPSDWYQFAKDFASPIATTIAAFVAAGITSSIAYRQWKTAALQANIALDKLKYDTFKDRLAVVEATEQLIDLAIKRIHADSTPYNKMNEKWRIIDAGRYYFGPSLNRNLEDIVEDCFSMVRAYAREQDIRDKPHLVLNNYKFITLQREKLHRHRNDLYKIFENDLSLDLLRAGSEKSFRAMRNRRTLQSWQLLLLAILGAAVLGVMCLLGFL